MDRSAPELTPALPLPAPRHGCDQVVVLSGVPWQQYDALCRARADAAGPRMAYLDGELEIMSPSRRHEHEKTLLARLIEAYGEEMGLSLNGFGSETFRRKAKEAGVEPDECYCVGPARKLPDFAVEIAYSSGGVAKLEIYRRLGVREVWFWIRARFHVYRLAGRRYQKHDTTDALRGIDLDELAAIVVRTDASHQTEAVRAYRLALRRRGRSR